MCLYLLARHVGHVSVNVNTEQVAHSSKEDDPRPWKRNGAFGIQPRAKLRQAKADERLTHKLDIAPSEFQERPKEDPRKDNGEKVLRLAGQVRNDAAQGHVDDEQHDKQQLVFSCADAAG